MRSPWRIRLTPEVLLILFAMLGYTMASLRLGESYPFSPLSMFSAGLGASSRVVVRAAGGRECEITDFARWHCDGPVDFGRAPHCPQTAVHPENDRNLADFVRSHPGAPGEGVPVEVVRRVFHIENPAAAPTVDECDLVKCTAVAVRGPCASTR